MAHARTVVFDAGIQRVPALTARAVDALEDLLNEKKHPSVRLGAARAVLDLAVSRYDADRLIRRIEELEDMQRQASPPSPVQPLGTSLFNELASIVGTTFPRKERG